MTKTVVRLKGKRFSAKMVREVVGKLNRIAAPWAVGADFVKRKAKNIPPWKGSKEIHLKKYRKREASVEKGTVRKAKEQLGIMSRKMNGLGFNSWPDRMFMVPRRPFFIEFKRVGEEPTPLQQDNHSWLRSLGYEVEVHDSTDEAFESIRRHTMEAIRHPKERNKVPAVTRRRRVVPGSRRR